MSALMGAAKDLTGDGALALHFGEAVDMTALSIVALIAAGLRDTPDEALAALNRLRASRDRGGCGRCRPVRSGARDGKLLIVDRRPDPNAFPELTESTFARMVCTARRQGFDLVREIHVTHKAPPYASEYDRIFQVPILFESGWNAIQLDEAAMPARLATQPPYVQALLNERAEALLEELEGSKTMRGRVESLLAPILPGGGATIQAVAASLGISRQTLYRRLKLEGVTFETVLDDLRHALALRYMRGGEISIEEAAYRVGFADRAAFSHAFKRWTGTSPKGRGGADNLDRKSARSAGADVSINFVGLRFVLVFVNA